MIRGKSLEILCSGVIGRMALMWKSIFENDEDERRRSENRSQAFAAICQAMKNGHTIYYSKLFLLMRELDDLDPKDAYEYILKKLRPRDMDTQITIEAEIANLKINDGETVPELINRDQFLITRLPNYRLNVN